MSKIIDKIGFYVGLILWVFFWITLTTIIEKIDIFYAISFIGNIVMLIWLWGGLEKIDDRLK